MSEKTEEPTAKKLDDARKKGQSPKSPDLTASVILAGMLMVLVGLAPSLLDALSAALKMAMHQGMAAEDNDALLALAGEQAKNGLLAVLPLIGASVALGVVGVFAQVGFNVSFEPVSPKFENLNPGQGLQKMVSTKTLLEVAKAVAKAVTLGLVVWVVVKGLMPLMVGAAYLSPAGAGLVAWKGLLELLAAACLVFAVIGPIDYGIQRFMFMRDQRMSKDDIKREHKDSNGDPHVKGHLSSLRQEMANEEPAQRVPGAAVVITNPTHYAVALRYDAVSSPLPVVVAKGMDVQAAVIRSLASEHGIPIVGDPPLARALHKLPLDEPIPPELFEAVAAVLRWVRDIEGLKAAP